MLLKVIAEGIGHGMGHNNYPAEVEFFVSEDADEYEIKSKAIFRLKDKTACDSVTVKSIAVAREITLH